MVRLLYFGRMTDVTSVAEEQISLQQDVVSSADLRSWLDKRFEAEGAFLDQKVRIAVDSEIRTEPFTLNGSGEIAFLPPVGGG